MRFNHSLGRAAEITLALVTAVLASVSVISAAPVAAATPGTWSPIGGPGPGYGASNAIVWDVAFYNGDLYVAGDFDTTFQGQNAFNLARWNGTAWSGVGTNFDETEVVRELEVLGDYLYIGGAFTDAANIPEADNIARWNGTTWSAVGPTGPGESAIDAGPAVGVESMAVRGTDLLIGGSFENVDNKEAADNIARWSGSDWFAIGANDSGNGAIQGGVKDILVRPDGFYAAGAFRDVNGIDAADYVAFWDGDDWLPLPESQIAINNTVNALVMTGNDLYLGGNFLNLEGSERPDLSNYVARWDGTDWHGVGIFNDEREDLNGPVFDLAIYNGQIIAGGNFNSQADAIGVYDGTSWSTLGPDGALHGMVFNLVVNGSDLYVSGRFSNAGGIDNADHLAIFRAPINRPDGRIRKGTGAYIGNNVYNTDGSNQTSTGSKARGKTVTFDLSVQNDGSTKRRFTIRATGTATNMYQVRYFRGSSEITAAIQSGTYQTSRLSPGSSFVIQARVRVMSNATVGSSVTRALGISPSGASTALDVVKLKVSRS